jgi:hypothetical protein
MSVIPVDRLSYSDKYTDDEYEYRHVIVPKEYQKSVKINELRAWIQDDSETLDDRDRVAQFGHCAVARLGALYDPCTR